MRTLLTLILFFVIIIASFGELLFTLSHDQRRIVRRLESETKKLSNTKHAVVFNDLCIRENLLPKYSNIYIYTRDMSRHVIKINSPKLA